MSRIKQICNNIVQTYGTSNPFIIAELLNIIVEYAPLNDSLGHQFEMFNQKVIVLSSELENKPEAKFVMAHELFHALYHDEGLIYAYKNAYNEKGKYEREANEFATLLCLHDVVLEEDVSVYEVLKQNYIPEKMEEFIK